MQGWRETRSLASLSTLLDSDPASALEQLSASVVKKYDFMEEEEEEGESMIQP